MNDEYLILRQEKLQKESQEIVEELQLIESLGRTGIVRQTGSTTLGLMVWRDIDIQVSSPAVSVFQAFETMQPILSHPLIKQVRYFHQSGRFKLEGLDERLYFMVFYESQPEEEWKLDISFWLADGIHPEPIQDFLEQQLTSESRLTILRIKDIWYKLPNYRTKVFSTDIYDAVLKHGIRDTAEFDTYLTERGKPSLKESL